MRLIVPFLGLMPAWEQVRVVLRFPCIRYFHLNGQDGFSNMFAIANFVIGDNIPRLNYSLSCSLGLTVEFCMAAPRLFSGYVKADM